MKKTLAIMLALIMVLALVPTVAFAAGNTIYVDANNGNDATGDGTQANPYATVDKAAAEAASGDTIYLAAGAYCGNSAKPSEAGKGAGKNLTFVGAGPDQTTWQIRAKENNLPGDGPCDYSFDGSDSITFEKMTVVGSVHSDNSIKADNYQGFVRINHLKLKDCTFNGRADYWGYETTTFENVTFYAPGTEASEIKDVGYSLWTWTGTEYTFNNCTFNSAGKVINVYHEDGERATTINFNNCMVNSTNPESLSVMNINDTYAQSFTINFKGKNTIKGIKADGIKVTGGSHASAASNTNPPSNKTSTQATCSKLFEFNMKYGNGNNGKTTVNIDGTTVWQDGKRVSHAMDIGNDKYTDGYKDNAFTVTPNEHGSFDVTCDYCGYKETSTGKLYNDIGLTRTVRQNKNSNPVPEDTPNSNKYKVANSSDITVDYTATMDMTNLEWKVAGKDVKDIPGALGTANSPWELLKYLASKQQIDGKTEVILTFKFDDDKIDLGTFQTNYNATKPEDKEKLLKLTSDMFEMTDVVFGTDNTMTIKCNWNWNKETDPDHAPAPKITLNGYGLPVKSGWNGSKIDIKNSGCVGGTVHIKNPRTEKKVAMAEPVPYVAANVQAQNTYPPVDNTIKIPIVGGCKTDEFTLYYGGGSSSGDSGHSYYYPTTTPVPVIVIPPKTGDMTVWQSILHFLGIR